MPKGILFIIKKTTPPPILAEEPEGSYQRGGTFVFKYIVKIKDVKLYKSCEQAKNRFYFRSVKSMSKNSEVRHKLKIRYFGRLEETSFFVDPYVDNFINSYLDISDEMKLKVLERYRFKKPKLRPAQVRFAYELAGGQDWEKVIPLCGAIELKDTSYYCADDVFDKNENSRTMYIIGNLLSVIANSIFKNSCVGCQC